MGASHLVGHALDFGRMLEHWIVAVPLNEVGASHERPVLGCSAVIVPKVEVGEIDRFLEGLSSNPSLRKPSMIALVAATLAFVLATVASASVYTRSTSWRVWQLLQNPSSRPGHGRSWGVFR